MLRNRLRLVPIKTPASYSSARRDEVVTVREQREVVPRRLTKADSRVEPESLDPEAARALVGHRTQKVTDLVD